MIYRLLQILTVICFSFSNLSAQIPEIDVPQVYVFPEFQEGVIITEDGKRIESLLNYHMLDEKMYMSKNNYRIVLDEKLVIDTVMINGRKFIPVNGSFYELLSPGKISLCKQHHSNLTKTGTSSVYGEVDQSTSARTLNFGDNEKGSIPDGYLLSDASKYWLKYNDEMSLFKSKKHLLKLVPEIEDELKTYIKENNLNLSEEMDLIKLIGYTNHILPSN